MKADVLVLNQSLDTAMYNSMLAVEQGNFIKVIELLEYVKKYSSTYDHVMVNYALLISYMNTGQVNHAAHIIEEFANVKIENQEIQNVVDSVKKDLSKHAPSSLPQKGPQLKINIDNRTAKLLHEVHPNDGIWNLVLNSKAGNKAATAQLNSEILHVKDLIQKLDEMIIQFENFTETITPLEMYDFINEIEDNMLFWYAYSNVFPKKSFVEIFDNKELPLFVKKYFLERMVYLIDYGIRHHGEYLIGSEVYDTKKLFHVLDKVVVKAQRAQVLFDEMEVEFTADMMDSYISVIKIIQIEMYPSNNYSDEKLLAITSYIINDFFLGRDHDRFTKEFTGFSFEDVKEDIKKFENLITFLLK